MSRPPTTRFLDLRISAVGYGIAVAATGVVISYVVLVPQLSRSDHWPWLLHSWRLVALPATVILGLISALGYDLLRRLTVRRLAKFGFFAANSALVAAAPYVLILW